MKCVDWKGGASIAVMKGYQCHECQYSAAAIQVKKNHFSKEHNVVGKVDICG